MSIATYGALKTAVAAWGNRSDTATTDNIPDFVAWAHQEINRRLRASVLLASADVTVSAETVSAPTGYLATKRMYLASSIRRRLFTCSAESAMDLSSELATADYPTHVAVEGSTLRFAPLFTTSSTGKALYYKAAITLTDDGDTNVVLTAYPFLYLYGALEALNEFLENTDQAQRWGGKFGALIEDINTRDAMDVMSGPLQSMINPAGVV